MKKVFFSIIFLALASSLSAPALGGGLREFLEEHPPLEGKADPRWGGRDTQTMTLFNGMPEKPEWATKVPLKLPNHDETQPYNFDAIVDEGYRAILVKATPESSANPTLVLKLRILGNYDSVFGSMFGGPFQKYTADQYARFRSPEEGFFSGIGIWPMEYVDDALTLKEFLRAPLLLTIQALSAPAQTIFRGPIKAEEYGYKDAACEARVKATSGAGGRVSVDLPKTSGLSLLFSAVQAVPVRKAKQYTETLDKGYRDSDNGWIEAPNGAFLRKDRWEAIINAGDKCQSSVLPEGLGLRYQPYEIWSRTWSQANPNFLGYLSMRRAPKSLDEFFIQHPFSHPDETRRATFNSMARKPGWTRGISVMLDTQVNPQLYDLEEIVGEGSDGTVFRAVPQDALNPVAALKMWSAGVGDASKDIEMSQKGISQYCRLLSHKEQTFSDQVKGLVMEYINGPTLEEFLRQPPAALGLENAESIIQDIRTGLEAFNLLDFSPVNVMLRKEADGTFTVRFIDFATWEDGSTFRDNRPPVRPCPRFSRVEYYQEVVKAVANMVTNATQVEKDALMARHLNP